MKSELILVKGWTKRMKPEVGTTFGKYVVISEEVSTDGKKTYWLVKCSCGNECWIRQDILKSKSAQKCRACSNKEKFKANVELGKMHTRNYSPKHYGVGDLSRSIYKHYKWMASSRGIEFNVSIEFLWELYLKQEGKCALTGIDIYLRPIDKTSTITTVKNGWSNLDYSKFNCSLDRIDSSRGYLEDNVQWIERKVNIMKMDISQQDFINICKLVTNNVNQQPS